MVLFNSNNIILILQMIYSLLIHKSQVIQIILINYQYIKKIK